MQKHIIFRLSGDCVKQVSTNTAAEICWNVG